MFETKFEGQFTVGSELEAQALAADFAKALSRPCVILLEGNLGAGKTTFVRFVCQALEIAETVSSPSYTIINCYRGKGFPIYHMDCYRLSDAEELLELGVEEFLRSEICFIEWPNAIRHLLTEPHYEVQISTADYITRHYHFRYVKEQNLGKDADFN